ncbi:MAG: hypothetical protein COT25_04605 [Candidatus Kerfeldbacteria bacterium CG08_land_8_20_14_0_20_42_7]|uniref:Ribosomal protein L9 domain-containing protein n=1 Tax=Candidatus Kerfeldbacteria bacterium CG08_land_8_20_14_0_20_42_7 TaxID=2014245 RepID=A0A2H0YSA3_9BACT|nr:MAG: hypothetical protein COT25_04605 [Candidatus Kerfeldbacteria bacterium CG08_land_8_20_14_0_20_42_7]
MYVTLLTDVKGLGKKTERVRVSDAYARNVLIPQKRAFVGEQTPFTASAQLSAKNLPSPEDIVQLLTKPLQILKRANENGGLYEKFTEKECIKDIAHLLKVFESQIHLKGFSSIKNIGEHTIPFTVSSKEYSLQVIIQQK